MNMLGTGEIKLNTNCAGFRFLVEKSNTSKWQIQAVQYHKINISHTLELQPLLTFLCILPEIFLVYTII